MIRQQNRLQSLAACVACIAICCLQPSRVLPAAWFRKLRSGDAAAQGKALRDATRSGNLAKVKRLVRAGATIHVADNRYGWTPSSVSLQRK